MSAHPFCHMTCIANHATRDAQSLPEFEVRYDVVLLYCLEATLMSGDGSATKRISLDVRKLSRLRSVVLQAFGLASSTEFVFTYTDGEDLHATNSFRLSVTCRNVFLTFHACDYRHVLVFVFSTFYVVPGVFVF